MKRSTALAILGIAAASATTSYGQGYVRFENYFASTSPTLNFPMTGVTPASKAGLAFGGAIAAELLWYNGLTANQSLLTPLPASITYFSIYGPSPNSTPDGDIADGAGYFFGPIVSLSGYTSGLATFQIFLFGTEGANSYAAISGLFTMTPATGGNPVPGLNQIQVGVGSIQLDPASWIWLPEPTTLALGALGGLSLWLFRRQKA